MSTARARGSTVVRRRVSYLDPRVIGGTSNAPLTGAVEVRWASQALSRVLVLDKRAKRTEARGWEWAVDRADPSMPVHRRALRRALHWHQLDRQLVVV